MGAPRQGHTRRTAIQVGLGAAIGLALPARPATAQGFQVLPRSAWAGDRPAGPIAPEPDVRTLVVHHTVDANTYGPDDVVTLLQRIHAFHTGPEKRWPDVAYNFFVDRFGRAWEARAGSLAGPVAGDATGGNQGSDQKCAFLGDHSTEPPTPEAAGAMADLLAMLADRHGIDTTSGATATFVSRGSNLHPPGSTVTVGTITGHRTVSRTSCPGDAGMALVTDVLPGAVSARRQPAGTTTSAPVATTTTSAAAEPPSTTAPAASTPSAPATTDAGGSPAPTSTTTLGQPVVPRATVPDGDGASTALPAGVAAIAALGAGALALRARRTGR